MVIYDAKKDKILAARDPMGIRPMFYGYHKEDGKICFASEKGLFPLCQEIMPFPLGHYYEDGKFICYNDLSNPKTINNDDLETIATNLRLKLEKQWKKIAKRCSTGYLLSGGLDSSWFVRLPHV
ncbi:MAG: hypothetical protein ACLRWM_11065 [Streptococcus sp.]